MLRVRRRSILVSYVPAAIFFWLTGLAVVTGCPGRAGQAVDCADGQDNDGDGFIDYPDDPGCDGTEDGDEANQRIPECNDGVDNDGDGLIDHPDDPGCFSLFDGNESDSCPLGSRCPRCGNQWDDDGDGLIDYPEDPGCDTASDNDELDSDVTHCGPDVGLTTLALGTYAWGSASAGGANHLVSPICGGLGQEHVYAIEVPEAAVLVASTMYPQTTLDTVLYLRSVCRDITTELACSDDAQDRRSELEVAVEPGTYFLVVDAFHWTSEGEYRVRVDSYRPPGQACDPAMSECLPGYSCRPRDDNAATPTCELPACADGLDNDFDGRIDHPGEPGCDNPADDDEHDDCPLGGDCPACSNTVDDDGDGAVDHPADPGCQSASDRVEMDCAAERDPMDIIDSASELGTTLGASDDFTPGCSPGTAPDHAWLLDVPFPLASLRIDTLGSVYDTVLSVRTPTCEDTELECNDDHSGARSAIQLGGIPPGPYLVVVDGAGTAGGLYRLNTHGVISAGSACEPALELSGLFSCEPGYMCDGIVCAPAACQNGLDDDADGFIDHPGDPGCASPGDADESDDCAFMGPNCPACANSADDDGDGLTDHPDDPGCTGAGDRTEVDCLDSDPVLDIIAPTTMGTTAGASDDATPSCSASNAPEHVYVLDIPGTLQSLELDTNGSTYDTVLYVRQPECLLPDLACDDDGGAGLQSAVALSSVPPGPLFIFIDGHASGAGSYILHVEGVIAPGAACDPAQISAGILACAAGTSCLDPGSGFACR